jgi:hypothetical protein
MSTSVVPALIDALVARCDAALSAVSVYDGYGVTDNPGDFLMVGVEDPDSQDSASSSDASQEVATMGTNRSRDERGTVSCVALSWNGDGDQKAARDRVYATTAAVESLLRANPDLGIPGYALVVTGFGADQRLMQNQDTDGAEAAVFFTVRFRARL